MSFFLARTQELHFPSRWWIMAALGFSLVGDVLLMRSAEIYFLSGMGAFALAHLTYAAFFMKNRSARSSVPGLLVSLVVIVLSLYFLNRFIQLPATISLPVNAYGAVLSLSLLLSVQFGFGGARKSWQAPLGVLLFVVSDLLLATGRFNYVQPEMWLKMSVMLSYSGAQFFIIWGALEYALKSGLPKS